MRLKEYLNDIDKVRNIKIGLVKNEAEYHSFIQSLKEKYDLKRDIIKEIDEFNQEFKKIYKGKFKFDFCIQEDINIDSLKIKNLRIKEKLKLKWFQLNHDLSKIKTELEDKLSV